MCFQVLFLLKNYDKMLDLGQTLTEADLFQLLSDVYEENQELNKNVDTDKFDGNVEFHIFLRMIEHLYRVLEEDNREQDFSTNFFLYILTERSRHICFVWR